MSDSCQEEKLTNSTSYLGTHIPFAKGEELVGNKHLVFLLHDCRSIFVFANKSAHIVIISCLVLHISFPLHFVSYLHVCYTCNLYGLRRLKCIQWLSQTLDLELLFHSSRCMVGRSPRCFLQELHVNESCYYWRAVFDCENTVCAMHLYFVHNNYMLHFYSKTNTCTILKSLHLPNAITMTSFKRSAGLEHQRLLAITYRKSRNFHLQNFEFVIFVYKCFWIPADHLKI